MRTLLSRRSRTLFNSIAQNPVGRKGVLFAKFVADNFINYDLYLKSDDRFRFAVIAENAQVPHVPAREDVLYAATSLQADATPLDIIDLRWPRDVVTRGGRLE